MRHYVPPRPVTLFLASQPLLYRTSAPQVLRQGLQNRVVSELLRINLLRLYEKWSITGEPPRHETNHGSIYERLPARTQPLVVLAHPPLLIDPGDRPLHYPSSR